MPQMSLEEQQAFRKNSEYQQYRNDLLKKLLNAVDVDKHPTLNVHHRENGKNRASNILFFKFEPNQFVQEPDVVREVLDSLESVIRYSIERGPEHPQLTPAQRDIQLQRHVGMSILQKLTREQNPHHCWLALNLSASIIRIEACIFLDPEEVLFVGKTTFTTNGKEHNVEIDVSGVEVKSQFTSPEMRGSWLGSHLMSILKLHVYHYIQKDIIALVPFNAQAQAFFANNVNGFEGLGMTKVEVKQPRKEPISFWFYLMVHTLAKLTDRYGVRDTRE